MTKNKAPVRVISTDETSYHHMPDHEATPDTHGLTVRELLAVWRGVDWGNIGGSGSLDLSDGTCIDVELQFACGVDGCVLMSSQHAVRRDRVFGRIIRTYALIV